MNSSNNNFNVPTLTLSSYRSKKNNGTFVPTHDYTQKSSTIFSNYQQYSETEHNQESAMSNNVYKKAQKNSRPPIFPPKSNNNQIYEEKNQFNNDGSSRDLNKNVYLQRRQEILTNYNAEENVPYIRKNTSTKNLLSNPMSSRVIEEQMNQRDLTRKSEINKVLFQRKLNKLLQQVNFYDEQLLSLSKDDLAPHVSELQSIRKNNIDSHKELLHSLNALIS